MPSTPSSTPLLQASLQGRADEFIAAFNKSEIKRSDEEEVERQLHLATFRRELYTQLGPWMYIWVLECTTDPLA